MEIKTRILGVVLVLVLVFGTVFGDFCKFNDVSDTYAESTKISCKASDLNAGKYPEIYDTEQQRFKEIYAGLLELTLDEKLHVKGSILHCNLDIKGDKTLFVDDVVNVGGNVNIYEDAKIAFNQDLSLFNSINSGHANVFTIFGTITSTDAKHNIIFGFDEVEFKGNLTATGAFTYLIYGENSDVYIDGGSMTFNNCYSGIFCKNLYMCGGTITSSVNYSVIKTSGDINITGGTINASQSSTKYYDSKPAIYAGKDISISGGTVKVNSKDNSGIYSVGQTKIKGGYVEASTGCTDNAYSAIDSDSGITIGSGWVITEPSGGKVIKDTKFYRVANASGAVAKKAVIQKYVPSDSNSGSSNSNSSNGSSNGRSNGSSGSNSSSKSKPCNEWVKGQWYDSKGNASYKYKGSWKSNSKGWWFEDASGWYAYSQWQKIDGKWYYFCADGYMDYSEYRDGCWLGSDGAWNEDYSNGKWHLGSRGWWYSDGNWYPANQNLWIDGTKYYFNSEGYWQ